ncbi:hypothetical protein MAPG_10775, partial [Magnaporthiopsis poae ATCC 64411]
FNAIRFSPSLAASLASHHAVAAPLLCHSFPLGQLALCTYAPHKHGWLLLPGRCGVPIGAPPPRVGLFVLIPSRQAGVGRFVAFFLLHCNHGLTTLARLPRKWAPEGRKQSGGRQALTAEPGRLHSLHAAKHKKGYSQILFSPRIYPTFPSPVSRKPTALWKNESFGQSRRPFWCVALLGRSPSSAGERSRQPRRESRLVLLGDHPVRVCRSNTCQEALPSFPIPPAVYLALVRGWLSPLRAVTTCVSSMRASRPPSSFDNKHPGWCVVVPRRGICLCVLTPRPHCSELLFFCWFSPFLFSLLLPRFGHHSARTNQPLVFSLGRFPPATPDLPVRNELPVSIGYACAWGPAGHSSLRLDRAAGCFIRPTPLARLRALSDDRYMMQSFYCTKLPTLHLPSSPVSFFTPLLRSANPEPVVVHSIPRSTNPEPIVNDVSTACQWLRLAGLG